MKRSGEPDWDRMERAARLAEREEFRRTSPGQRVEEQIEMSREITKLAARRRRSR